MPGAGPGAEALERHPSARVTPPPAWQPGDPPQVSAPRWSELKRRFRGRLARKAERQDMVEHDRSAFDDAHPGSTESPATGPVGVERPGG